MIDFEGVTSEPSRRSKHQIMFEDEDDDTTDLASTMASVSASDQEAIIDSNVSTIIDPFAMLQILGEKPLRLVRLLEVATSILNLYRCSKWSNLHFLNAKKLHLHSSWF